MQSRQVLISGRYTYQEEAGQWEGLIEAAMQDMGLSRERRAAAVAALRLRQQAAARGAQQKAIEEEHQKLQAFRRHRRQLAGRPKAALAPAA